MVRRMPVAMSRDIGRSLTTRARMIVLVVVSLLAGFLSAQPAQAVYYGAPYIYETSLAGPDSVRIRWWWPYESRPYQFHVVVHEKTHTLAVDNSEQLFDGGSDEVLVKGLPPATYTFDVFAEDYDFGATTSTGEITVPQLPVDGITTFVGSDRVGLRWNAYPRAVSYQVSAAPADGSPPTVRATNALSSTLTGLLPGTRYVVDVVAQLPGGEASSSAGRIITTKVSSIQPQAPPVVVWGVTSARISWVAGDGAVSWRIAVTGPSWADGRQTFSTAARSAVASGLTPGADYSITLTPIGSNGQTGGPATVSGRVTGIGLPAASAPDLTQSDATVVIAPPVFDKSVTAWRVLLLGSSGSGANIWYAGLASEPLVLGSLTPGATYTAQFQGRSLAGTWGPLSPKSEPLTLRYWAPPGAASVTASGTSINSARVTWVPTDETVLGWTVTVNGGVGAALNGKVISLPADARSYDFEELTRGKTYTFAVRGIGPKGTSDPVTASWAAPKGKQVSDFRVTTSGKTITAQWFGELQPGEMWTIRFFGLHQRDPKDFYIFPTGGTTYTFSRDFARDSYYVAIIRNFDDFDSPQAFGYADTTGKPRNPRFDQAGPVELGPLDDSVTLTGKGEPGAWLRLDWMHLDDYTSPSYGSQLTVIDGDGTWSLRFPRSTFARGDNSVTITSWEDTDGRYLFADSTASIHVFQWSAPQLTTEFTWGADKSYVRGTLAGDVVGDTVTVEVSDASGAIVAAGDAPIWRNYLNEPRSYYIEFESPGVFYTGDYNIKAVAQGHGMTATATATANLRSQCWAKFTAPESGASLPHEPLTISGTTHGAGGFFGTWWANSIKVSIDGRSVFSAALTMANGSVGWDSNNGASEWSFIADLDPGSHTLQLETTDRLCGIPYRTTRTVTISGDASPLVVNQLPDGASRTPARFVKGTTGQTADVSVVVKNANGDTVASMTITPQGTRTAAGYAWSVPLSDFGDGTFTVTVTQRNDGGTDVSTSSTWTVDRTGPQLSLAETPAVDGDGFLSLYGTTTPGDGVITVRANGVVIGTAAPDSNTGRWTLTTMRVPEGTSTVTLTETDALGNSVTLSFQVFIDYTAPTLVATAAENPSQGTVVFKGTTDDTSPVRVLVWSVAPAPTCGTAPADAVAYLLNPSAGAWQVTVTGMAAGFVCATASQTDKVGRTITVASSAMSRAVSTVSAFRLGSGLAVDSETIAVSVNGADTGTVQVRRYGRLYSTATLVNGVAAVALDRGFGNEPVTVTYVGSGMALPSSATVNVTWLGTASSAFDSLNDRYGAVLQNRTLQIGPYDFPANASVFMRAVNISALPTGTVQVLLDGTVTSTITLPYSNFYGFTLSLPAFTADTISPGVHSLILRYSGDTRFAPQVSPTYTVIVGSGVGGRSLYGGIHQLSAGLGDLKGVVGTPVSNTVTFTSAMFGNLTKWSAAGDVIARANGVVVGRAPLLRSATPGPSPALGLGTANLSMQLPVGRNTITYTWEMDGVAYPFQLAGQLYDSSVTSASQTAFITGSSVVLQTTVTPTSGDVLRPGQTATLTVRVADRDVSGNVTLSGDAAGSGSVACVQSGCQTTLVLPASNQLTNRYVVTFTATEGSSWTLPFSVTKAAWQPTLVVDTQPVTGAINQVVSGRVVWPAQTPSSIRQAVNVTVSEVDGHLVRTYCCVNREYAQASVQPGTDDRFSVVLPLQWGSTNLRAALAPVGDHSNTATLLFAVVRAGRSAMPTPIAISTDDPNRGPRVGEGMYIILPFDTAAAGPQDPISYTIQKTGGGSTIPLYTRYFRSGSEPGDWPAIWRTIPRVSADVCGADLSRSRCPIWSPLLSAPARVGPGNPVVGWPGGDHEFNLRMTYADGTTSDMPFTIAVDGWPARVDTSVHAGAIPGDANGGTTGVDISVQPTWRDIPISSIGDPYLSNGSYSASRWPSIEGGVLPQRVSVSLALSFIDANNNESNAYGIAQCSLNAYCINGIDTITYGGVDYTPRVQVFSDADNRLRMHVWGLPPAAKIHALVTTDAPWSEPVVQDFVRNVGAVTTGAAAVNGVAGFYEGPDPQDVDLSKIVPFFTDLIDAFQYTQSLITNGIKSVFGDNGFSEWLGEQIGGLLDPMSWIIGAGIGKLVELGVGPLLNMAFKTVFPRGMHTMQFFMDDIGWSIKSAAKYAVTEGAKKKLQKKVTSELRKIAEQGWDSAVDKAMAARATQRCVVNGTDRCTQGAVFSVHTLDVAADIVASSTLPLARQRVIVDMDNNYYDNANWETGRTTLATCDMGGACTGVADGQQVVMEGERIWVRAYGDPTQLGFNPSSLRVRVRLVSVDADGAVTGQLASWSWGSSLKHLPLLDEGDRTKAYTWLRQQDPHWSWQQGLPFAPWGPGLTPLQQERARDDQYLRVARVLSPQTWR